MFNLYLFSRDETATLLCRPALTLAEIPETLSDDQIRQVFLNEYAADSVIPDTSGWSAEKAGQALLDVHGIGLDSCAVVPVQHQSMIQVVGEALAETFSDDSSCYSACAVFGRVLESVAVKVLDFPSGNNDQFYEDMD